MSSDTKMLERIKEQIANAGIEVEVETLENGVLTVCPVGLCAGCYHAEAELKQTLQEQFPQIEEICVEQRFSEETLDFARKLLSRGDQK